MAKKEVPPDGSDKTPDTSPPSDGGESPFDVDLDPSLGTDAGGDLPEGFPSADDLLGSDAATATDPDDDPSTSGYEPLDIGPDENVIAYGGPATYTADGEYNEVDPEDITPDVMADDDTGVLPDMAIVGPSDSTDGAAGLADSSDGIADTPPDTGDGSSDDDPPDPEGAAAAADEDDTVVAADSNGDDPIEQAAADEADTLVADDPDSADDASDGTLPETETADTSDDTSSEPDADVSEDDTDTSDDTSSEPEEETSAPVEAAASDDAGGGDD